MMPTGARRRVSRSDLPVLDEGAGRAVAGRPDTIRPPCRLRAGLVLRACGVRELCREESVWTGKAQKRSGRQARAQAPRVLRYDYVYALVYGKEVMGLAATATVRVEPEVRDRINALAAARGVKASQLLGQLVRAAEEDQLLADMNADFAALGQDPKAREAYDEELQEWDATMLDGLGEEA